MCKIVLFKSKSNQNKIADLGKYSIRVYEIQKTDVLNPYYKYQDDSNLLKSKYTSHYKSGQLKSNFIDNTYNTYKPNKYSIKVNRLRNSTTINSPNRSKLGKHINR